MITPSPFVYWAQTEENVSLKIELKNVVNPEVEVTENNVKFAAQGIGARGENHYEFSLDLFSSVKLKEDKPVFLRVFDNRVEINLHKTTAQWWPRVTAQPQKPAWLKINFDLWKSEDGQDSEEEKRDVMQDYPGIYDRLQQEELGYRKEDYKKVYLILYNAFQFIGYTFLFTVMFVRYLRDGSDAIADTYKDVGSTMKFLQLLQFLEVMHPLFGYTKGGVVVPLCQVSGRAFVLFAMIDSEPRMHTKPVVCWLFYVWTIIELVRYPFYLTQLFKKQVYILTWLRYTLWIPLYPLGVLCESVIILRNIPYFEETQKFTIALPNDWNFAFHMPTFLRVYLLFLTFPGLYLVMKHMQRLRSIKLKSKVVIKKSK